MKRDPVTRVTRITRDDPERLRKGQEIASEPRDPDDPYRVRRTGHGGVTQ